MNDTAILLKILDLYRAGSIKEFPNFKEWNAALGPENILREWPMIRPESKPGDPLGLMLNAHERMELINDAIQTCEENGWICRVSVLSAPAWKITPEGQMYLVLIQ